MSSNKILVMLFSAFCVIASYSYITRAQNKMDHMQRLLHEQQQTITYQNDVIVRLGTHVKILANEHRTQSDTAPLSID